jgi:hypothetical protein
MHVAAAGALAHGQLAPPSRILEDLSIRHPRDLLALQVGHQIDFFTGHSRMLRDRIARAESHWHAGMPGRHAVLSMLAFGLEESADYARAERPAGRAWSWSRATAGAGMRWRTCWRCRTGAATASPGCAPRTRLRGARAASSPATTGGTWRCSIWGWTRSTSDALLDQRVLGSASPLVLDMIDASALLWRLQLRGVNVGDRWDALADRWAVVSGASTYAFNDLHAMMAFVGADRMGDAARLLDAQEQALAAGDDNVGYLKDVGLGATQAIHQFGTSRHAEAAELLRRVRRDAARFGGSHAQRDVLDLTLIAAAERAGDVPLADALRRERAFVRN